MNPMADDDLTMRVDRMKAAARIRDLENDLAEARAQIAAKDEQIRILQHNADHWKRLHGEVRSEGSAALCRELRAQIAAKDAALGQCAVVFGLNGHEGMVAIIDAALAGPARETK